MGKTITSTEARCPCVFEAGTQDQQPVNRLAQTARVDSRLDRAGMTIMDLKGRRPLEGGDDD